MISEINITIFSNEVKDYFKNRFAKSFL